MSEKSLQDERLELNMSRLLIAGVIISGGLVAIGGLLYLLHHGLEKPEYGTFSGEPADLTGLKAVFTLIFQGRGTAIVMLGILVLIATPIARIIFAVIGFALEKDRLYTMISLIVLLIILASLFSGVAG